MDDYSRRAVTAALAVARGLGLPCSDHAEIVADGSNVLVHLVPSPVVAIWPDILPLGTFPWCRQVGIYPPVRTSTIVSR
jgi:hypothetical protein